MSQEWIEEEIECISEKDELTQRDFDFINLTFANYDIEIFKPLFPLFDKELDKKEANEQ